MGVSLNRLMRPHQRQKNYLDSPVKVDQACRSLQQSNHHIEFLLVINTLNIPYTVDIGLYGDRQNDGVKCLPLPSSTPNMTLSYPSNCRTVFGSPSRGRITLKSAKLLSGYLNVCEHNPPTLRTDRQHTTGIP